MTQDTVSDCEKATYRTTIEQVLSIDDDGSHTQLIEIVTDGHNELTDISDDEWAALSDDERADHNEWVEEMHDARVAIASAMPDVRARAEEVLAEMNADDHLDIWASLVGRALRQARREEQAPDEFISSVVGGDGQIVDVRTDAADVSSPTWQGEREWSELTEDERRAHNAWVYAVHEAEIEVARAPSKIRGGVYDRCTDTSDPTALRVTLAELLAEAESSKAGAA